MESIVLETTDKVWLLHFDRLITTHSFVPLSPSW